MANLWAVNRYPSFMLEYCSAGIMVLIWLKLQYIGFRCPPFAFQAAEGRQVSKEGSEVDTLPA